MPVLLRVAACSTALVLLASPATGSDAAMSGPPPHRGAHSMEIVSHGLGGTAANQASFDPAVSASGRYVAFWSRASNLVAGDDNEAADVFRYDTQNQTMIAVSVTPGNTTANSSSEDPAISGSGRYIAFVSAASDLVDVDELGPSSDIFRYDVQTGAMLLVSQPAVRDDYLGSFGPSISGDGRFIAFVSRSDQLTDDDTDSRSDIFVYDAREDVTTRVVTGPGSSYDSDLSANGRFVAYTRVLAKQRTQVFRHNLQTGSTVRVSSSGSGRAGNHPSRRPSISGSGQYVAYESQASNLMRNDSNHHSDVFRFNGRASRTVLVSVDIDGGPADNWSRDPDISLDGDKVVFMSRAHDLTSQRVSYQTNVYERYLRGSTVLGSEPAGARPPNGHSKSPAISGNGFSWAFESSATNLVRPDTPTTDVFLFAYV